MTVITKIKDAHSSSQVVIIRQRNKEYRRRCRILFITSLVFSYMTAYLFLSSNPKDLLPSGEISDIDRSIISTNSNKNNNTTFVEGTSSSSSSSSLHESRLYNIQMMASSITRIYQPVPSSTWCVDDRLRSDQLKRRPMGLCYLKIPRAAGTTLKGINMRIAHNFAQRHDIGGCIRHDSDTVGMYYAQRDKLSYLWTFIRDPTDRALSVIGSKLSRQLLRSNKDHNRDSFNATAAAITTIPTPKQPMNETASSFRGSNSNSSSTSHNHNHRHSRSNNILVDRTINMLQHDTDTNDGVVSEGRGGFQLQFGMQHYIDVYDAVDPVNPIEVINPPRVLGHVYRVFNKYDFVGLVERFDESLVALQLLLGLESSDILYFAVNKKNQWQRAKVGRNTFVCRKPFDWEVDLLPESTIREYVTENNEWYAQNYGDNLLYQAANQSLDRTILQIGLDVFVYELKKFRSLLKLAHEECIPKFPCSFDGIDQFNESQYDCMDGSFACGHQCLDGVSV